MKRETTNRIRTVLEDYVPPVLRDSRFFRWFAAKAWDDYVYKLADFRERSVFLTPEEYENLYRDHPQVQEGSDNSEACIDRIIKDIVGTSVLDVGCGTGMVLKRVKAELPGLKRLVGVDIVVDGASPTEGVEYQASKIEALPFKDNEFDTVVCTHVLEHVLDIREAVSEIRRVAKKRLIVVVPREREYKYTFNAHFHFFPYIATFLRVMIPVPANHKVEDVARDIYYYEDIVDV